MRLGIMALLALAACEESGFDATNRAGSQPGEVDQGPQTGGEPGPNPNAPSAQGPYSAPGSAQGPMGNQPGAPPSGEPTELPTGEPSNATAERAATGGTDDVSPETVGTNGHDGAWGTNGKTGTYGTNGKTGTYGTDGKTAGTDGRTGQATTPGTTAPPGTGQAAVGDAQEQMAKVLSDLHQVNVHEIALGRLAADKATTPELKEYADELLKAHTRRDDNLVKLARDEGIVLDEASTTQNKEQLAEFQRLEGLTGTNFDEEYLKIVINAHEETIDMVQTSLTTVQDPEVKGFLDKLVPDLQKHHKDAQNIKPKVKGT